MDSIRPSKRKYEDREEIGQRTTERSPHQWERPPNLDLLPDAELRYRWRRLREQKFPLRMNRW